MLGEFAYVGEHPNQRHGGVVVVVMKVVVFIVGVADGDRYTGEGDDEMLVVVM